MDSILMSSSEKQWVTKIQMMQIQTANPYEEDYYYQVTSIAVTGGYHNIAVARHVKAHSDLYKRFARYVPLCASRIFFACGNSSRLRYLKCLLQIMFFLYDIFHDLPYIDSLF